MGCVVLDGSADKMDVIATDVMFEVAMTDVEVLAEVQLRVMLNQSDGSDIIHEDAGGGIVRQNVQIVK